MSIPQNYVDAYIRWSEKNDVSTAARDGLLAWMDDFVKSKGSLIAQMRDFGDLPFHKELAEKIQQGETLTEDEINNFITNLNPIATLTMRFNKSMVHDKVLDIAITEQFEDMDIDEEMKKELVAHFSSTEKVKELMETISPKGTKTKHQTRAIVPIMTLLKDIALNAQRRLDKIEIDIDQQDEEAATKAMTSVLEDTHLLLVDAFTSLTWAAMMMSYHPDDFYHYFGEITTLNLYLKKGE